MMDIKMTDSLRSDILSQINDDIIMSNVLEQITNVSFKDIDKNEMDFIEVFNNRYNSVCEIAESEDDEKLMTMARDSKGRFYDNVAATIADMYGFRVDFRDNLLEDEIYETIWALYRFFVLEIFDNLSDYVTDIVVNSKTNIVEMNKDIKPDMLLSAMTEDLGKENALVIYFLGYILEGIDCGNLYEFVGRVTRLDPEEYTNILVRSLFSEEDTYVDTAIELNKCDFLNRNIRGNYKLRQNVESKVIGILKKGE